MMLHMKCYDTLKMRDLFSVQTTSKKRSFPPKAYLPLQLYRESTFIVTKIAHNKAQR